MAAFLARQSMLFACVFLLHVFHHNAVVAQTEADVANVLTPYLSTPGEKVDLVFVVDQSAFSEDKVSRGFLFMINFVKEILSWFTVDSDHTRVSLITFSTEASVRINYLDSRDETKCTVFSRLDEVREEVPQNRGLTATTDALRQAKEVLMESRSDAKKAVVLITDSYSTIGAPPAVASAEIRSLRWAWWDSEPGMGTQLEVFTVGVNGADEAELESVASSSRNAFNIDSFSTLRQASKLIHKVPENSSWEVTQRHYCGQCDTSASCACDTGLGQYHCVCNPGYHGDGITCQACPVDTYKDSAGPGTCTACPGNKSSPSGTTSVEDCAEVLCPVLPSVSHATSFHIYSPANEAQVNTFTTCKNTPGDFCYFQCDEGFSTSDATRLQCVGDSWVPRAPPTCQVVECGSITETAGMTVTYDHSSYGDYTYGTVATITCAEGYRTYGSTERTCTADGAWNGTKTQCQPTECPSLVPPAYGQISPSNCYRDKPEYLTVCTYSCDDGFLLVGPANRMCQSNDQWTDSGVASTCNDIQPPSIRCPSDRTLYSDDGNKKTFFWNNDAPEISDNSGFYNSYMVVPAYSNPYNFLVGIHTLTYKVTDAAGNEASCERRLTVEASQPPSLEFCPGTTTITVNTTTGALDWPDPVYLDAANNTVSTECDRTKGESASLGTHNIHCNAQGYRAVNLCSFQVILKASDCNIPADPLHGSSTCTATSTHQERCTVSCDAGYDFADPGPESEYLCSYSGVWTPEPSWPNCAAEERKGTATQTNTIRYDLSADSCDETVREEIRSSFNESFFQLSVVETQCANHECTLPEINVTCDTARRRRDIAQNSPMSERRQLKRPVHSRKKADLHDVESGRKARATNFVVTIVFIIRVGVPAGGTVSSGDQSDLIDILDEFYYELPDAVDDGSMDITIVIAGVSITCNAQAGSYDGSDPGLDTTCEDGQVSKQPSAYEASCVNCPVGTYKSGDSCVLCPHGQYQDQEAQQECLPCPDGTDTTRMGAINITECRQFCSPGHYSSTGLEDCTPCEVGSYQPNEKSTSCERCSNGTSTEAEGSTSENDCKVVCPAGSSSPTGVVPCSICAEDTYQTETGQRECVSCPDGYETDASGATSESDCKAHQLYVLTITLVITYNLDLPTYNENFMMMFEATGLPGEMTVTEVTSRPTSTSRLTTCTADYAASPSEARPNLDTFGQAFLDQLGTGMMGNVAASIEGFTMDVKDPCSPDPCNNGTCQEDPVRGYECTCTAGFTGTHCDINIDECAQNPCQHGSTCQDGINMFTCHCAPGYTGPLCEIDINDCSPNPCENGASCTDEVNAYNCYCMAGYDGTNCSINIDDCAFSPCRHGTCHDLVADYSCTCSAGYSGKDCDIDIDECQSQPCQNGGDCTDLVNAYSCSCAAGFEGTNCETDIDECVSDPCDNGGTCEDEQNGYRCLCAVGFIGTNCEQNPSPDFDFVMDGSSAHYAAAGNIPDMTAITVSFWLKTSDQLKFGTPVSYVMDTWETPDDNLLTLTDYGGFDLYVNGEVAYTRVAANVGQWTHVCVTWQSSDGSWQVFLNGSLEETGTGLATGQTIQGGGTFVLGQVNNPAASTPDSREAFAGQLSRLNLYSTVLPPADINAQAQGCSNDLGTLRGWTDFLSRVDTTAVQESPSQCHDFDECEEEDICSSHGVHVLCVNTVGAYNCTCAPGYEGPNCSRVINFCEYSPCQNGALCNVSVNDYKCICINGWGGKNCTEPANNCEPNPCKNGGTCTSSSTGYDCDCASDQYDPDRNCESTDLCADVTCENGGTCDSSNGSCTCSPGFEGTNCRRLPSTPCREINPCLNNGTCEVTNTSDHGYDCDCGDIETDNCEEPDVCSSDPCQNDGTCARNGTQRDTFICGCKKGTEGDLCEDIIDYCAPNPCQNGATCVNKVFEGFHCNCRNGFTGTNCESEIIVCTETQKQNLCQNGGTAFANGNTCACDCPEDEFVCAEEGLYGGFTPTCECSKCYDGDDDDDDGEDLYCYPDAGHCVVNGAGQSACQCDRGYSGKHCQRADHPEELCAYVTIITMRYKDIEGWLDTRKDNMGSNVANKTQRAYKENGYESWRINASYNEIREGSGGKVLVELAMTFKIPPEHRGEYDVPNLKEVLTRREELGDFNVSVEMGHGQCTEHLESDDLFVVYIAVGCVGGVVVILFGVVLAWHLKKKKTGLYSRPSSRIGPSPHDQEPIYQDIDSLPSQHYRNQAYVERHQSQQMAAWLSKVSSDAPPQYDNDDQQSERPSTSMSERPRYENESEDGSSVDLRSGIYPLSDVFTVVQPGGRSMDPIRTNRLYPNLRDSVTPSDIRIPMKQL